MNVTTVARHLRDTIRLSSIPVVRELLNKFQISIKNHDTIAAVPKKVLVFKEADLPESIRNQTSELIHEHSNTILHLMEVSVKNPGITRFVFPNIIMANLPDNEKEAMANGNIPNWLKENNWELIDKDVDGVVLKKITPTSTPTGA